MDCPKCVGKLEKKMIENIEVDSCFVCEGLWFDAGELEKALTADSKDFDFIDVGREEFDGKEAADLKDELNKKLGLCPRCTDKTLLMRGPYKGKYKTTVDVCPKGHGLWLDGGEINNLRDRSLVKIKEQEEYFREIMRYMFSSDGFQDFKRQVFGMGR